MDTQIEKLIEEFVRDYPRPSGIDWQKPLVAFARAEDPLFATLKKVASPIHALPQDYLTGAKTVITYFLPFSKDIVTSNKKGRFCSEAWGLAYIETNKLIAALNQFLLQKLETEGYRAYYVPPTHNFDESTLLCDWSHRSAAYIAGLGTFGLNRMLITAKGCCGRVGSLITNLEVTPTVRPTEEYCLYMQDQSCGRCAKKCVNEALQIDGFDKFKCYEILMINVERLNHLESIADACGKCLVGVPCSDSIPAARIAAQ